MSAMAAQTPTMDLTDTDEAILDILSEGRATQGYMVDETGESRQKLYSRLNILVATGHVKRVHDTTALYELVNDPRE